MTPPRPPRRSGRRRPGAPDGSSWQPLVDRDAMPHRLGDSLDGVARSLGLAAPAALGAVFGRWAEVVGDDLAAHVRPVSLRDGRLVVAVDDPAWATHLRYLEADLLRRLSAVAGTGVVTAVDVRVRRS